MRKIAWVLGAGLLALLGWLLLAPVPIEPQSWVAPPPPPRSGVLAPNDRLRAAVRVGAGDAPGPEATAFDAAGAIHAGLADGRVVRIDPRTGAVATVARTGGRPLGLAFAADGTLYVGDGVKGLLRVDPSSGAATTIATGAGGVRFGFTDDVCVGGDGTVYFTDATSRFGPGAYRDDILEHRPTGRLLSWDPASGTIAVLLSGLQFANGVALAGDGSYLVVAETGAYRLRKVWLDGPRRGTAEPFAENLPGFPDNVTWSPDRRVFWVALWPRVPAVDVLAPWPFLRKVVRRLPRALQPDPAPHAWVVAVDESGRVVDSLEWLSPAAFFPVTSVRERDGVLWLGSLEQDGIARIPAPPLSPSPPRP